MYILVISFIVGFVRGWGLVLVFLLLTLEKFYTGWILVILMTRFF